MILRFANCELDCDRLRLIRDGQTIAVEPKFVFPELGSIGIENTFAVTDQGGEKLSVLSDELISV